MHILIAPDSYKGSLTARQVCDILAQALAGVAKEYGLQPMFGCCLQSQIHHRAAVSVN